MITAGWVVGAERAPGPGNKGYPVVNAGAGIVWHSMEGWYAGSLAELMKPDRAASWMFSIKTGGQLVQHYPVIASPWASGNRWANTTFWSVELEGVHTMAINPAQMVTALFLIKEWEAYSGKVAVRPATMKEHREVATAEQPNAGPTACPSERYAPLWIALSSKEGETDEVTREEYEDLILSVFSGNEENELTREQRLKNALYRISQGALTAAEAEWSASVSETAKSAAAAGRFHEQNHPGADVVTPHRHVAAAATGDVL